MLLKDEYLEIKEFLRHRVCEINRSENIDREKQRKENTKYSLPNADSFGWMPAITLCYSFDIGNNQIMYMIPYRQKTDFVFLESNTHQDGIIDKIDCTRTVIFGENVLRSPIVNQF